MKLIAVILLGALLPAPCLAAEAAAPAGAQPPDRESYSLGYEFGNNLRRQGVQVDAKTLLQAVREGLDGAPPAVGADEIRETLVELRRRMATLQDQRFRQLAAENLEKGRAFLEANRAKEGVRTLPSGVQYRVLREGGGPFPKPTEMVTVNYRGTLVDGKEFDSSYARDEPETLLLQGTIKGWQEVLPLMATGSKWQVFVPAELAYGSRQFGRIPPGSALVFEIELLAVAEGIPQTSAGDDPGKLPGQEETHE